MENEVPTEETIKETLDAAEETVDGRTSLGKRLKVIEDILTLHSKRMDVLSNRIDVCSIRR